MVVDARNKEITLGSHVRYVDTGTIGKVSDIKEESNISWVKIDKTNLWYLADKLELLNDEDLKSKNLSDDNDNIDIEAIKNSENMFEDVDLSSSVANGGG
ncbi:DUF2098 domain-containing protein [uncultured Methanobrevibacter sp.]|uniref:DUF2098 domain-containing protein n=1 Tax=uncultured Methanobrevibacter sp. TaxID=253161 RepID=UPI002603D260|nr:DUF2098 domain-containing protein [uncultured Methanobrevibacter sp.]